MYHRAKFYLPLIILAFALFYAVSYGPWLSYSRKHHHLINKAVNKAYRPHEYAMYWSEAYFNYCAWWMKIGGGIDLTNQWGEYKKIIDEDKR